MICGASGSKSQTVVKVAGGDRIGAYWGHVIGGAQVANDVDNPIAHSHKGPVMAYMAKVDNAASAGLNGLKWFVTLPNPSNPNDRLVAGADSCNRFKIWQDTF